MSLIFAGILPNQLYTQHEQSDTPDTLATAIREFIGELYCMKPETVILLSEHGSEIPELLNINIYNPIELLRSNGAHFPITVGVDVALAAHIKEQSDIQQHKPVITTIAQEKVIPEIGDPLMSVVEHLPNVRTVVIQTAKNLNLEEHFGFGDFLRSILLATNKRVALIASGHLSVYESDKPQTAQSSFDTLCMNFLKSAEPQKILQINPDIREKSGTDIMAPLAVLLGAIHPMTPTPHVFAYDPSNKKGKIVVNFNLH